MKIEKLTPFFIPDSHKRICESGLSGQRHIGTVSLQAKSSKNGLDVDEMQALQAGDVLNVRWKIARRSISPQINIFYMPLTDQEKKQTKLLTKQNNLIETFDTYQICRRMR